ncbi:hypothetical protein VTN02DRAFT_934 [Thermoascus thermophilus]
MEYITRGVCGQEGCRETRYYLDNGLWFCRRGHQQEGRQVEADPDDFGTQGKTHRLKKAAVEKTQKTYRGRQAYTLFLQVYQLILWKQCFALVQGEGFPPQLENVVKDLWALRLQRLSDRIEDSSEADDDGNVQIFSSQAAASSEADETAQGGGRKAADSPRLIDSLALCYLGALLLRLPVGVGDFHRFAMREEIPYIRVIKSIPREMRDRLPQEYHSALDTRTLLKAEHLHRAVLDLALLYSREFGITFPPLNAPLMLFGYVKRLALPLEIYPAVNHLQKLVGFTYRFPTDFKGKIRYLAFPEAQMIALVVVATKLFFPFDDVKRYPTSLREPTAQVLDWKLWAQAQRQFESRATAGGRIGKGNEILVTENDVLKMTGPQLDEYMDWYEKSWLDSSRVSNPLADMFPTGRMGTGTETQPNVPVSVPEPDDEEAINEKIRTVMSELRPRRAVSTEQAANLEKEIPRPGSFYRHYRTESSLPETARPFYEAAAKVAGLSVRTLVRVVFQTELRIERWQEDRRRMEYHGEDVGFVGGDESMDEMDEDQAFSEPEGIMAK